MFLNQPLSTHSTDELCCCVGTNRCLLGLNINISMGLSSLWLKLKKKMNRPRYGCDVNGSAISESGSGCLPDIFWASLWLDSHHRITF